MLKAKKVPIVLFIKNVFKKDCVTDDIFDKKIMENIDDNMPTQYDQFELDITYTKLPKIFTNMETWPKTTNLLCWNCHQTFTGIPVFIPGVIEPISKPLETEYDGLNSKSLSFSMSVYGVFSSFGCAFSYVESHNYSLSERTEIISKLKMLHKIFYNRKIKDVPYFPSIFSTIQYGGDKTLDEFRNEMEQYKKENLAVRA